MWGRGEAQRGRKQPKHASKYTLKLDRGTAERIQQIYHTKPESTLTLRADTRLYRADDIQYRREPTDILNDHLKKRQRKALTANRIRERQLLAVHRQLESQTSPPRIATHNNSHQHLKLLYDRLFPQYARIQSKQLTMPSSHYAFAEVSDLSLSPKSPRKDDETSRSNHRPKYQRPFTTEPHEELAETLKCHSSLCD